MALELGLQSGGEAARRLIQSYDAQSSFCFSSPTRSLLAKGAYSEVPACRGRDITRRLDELTEELRDATIVGAVPFDPDAPARLLIPRRVEQVGPLPAAVGVVPPLARVLAGGRSSSASAELPLGAEALEARGGNDTRVAEARFRAGVETVLERIRSGQLTKAVLSRTLEVSANIDLVATVKRLLLDNAGAYGFALQLPSDVSAGGVAPERTLFGASPELLLSKQGSRVVSHPLAGSAPRSLDPELDRQHAERLLASVKDRNEHAIVVDEIRERLGPHCRSLSAPTEPSLLATPTMWHLATRVHGELEDPSVSSLELALALHPTPAVCGYPREVARQTIADLEAHGRGFFTGMIGWCDAAGDGEWAVCIRCAEYQADQLLLYAGAGIVEGSDPELEWRETRAKLNTMLAALSPASAPESRSNEALAGRVSGGRARGAVSGGGSP